MRCVVDGRLVSEDDVMYENGSVFCWRHFREMEEDRAEMGITERGSGKLIAEWTLPPDRDGG